MKELTDEYINLVKDFWQQQLSLDDWEITLDLSKSTESGTDAEPAHASVWRSKDYDEATITLSPNWRDWTELEANQNIVHELLHCKLRDVEHIIDLIDGQLHRDADKMVCASFQHAMEGFVDRMAKILIRLCDDNIIKK